MPRPARPKPIKLLVSLHALGALGAAALAAGCGPADPDESVGEVASAIGGPVELVAIGAVSGHAHDLSTETAGPLENGVSGNLLGGLGSGLAHADGDTFIALPDRGPNATPYNAADDDTTSYIDRFQTLTMTLAPSAPGASLPYELGVALTATTLLSSAAPLHYGSGAGVGLGSGAPALNAVHQTHYFTGRSDNFDPALSSLSAANGRLDPECARVSSDGKRVYVCDEYGPYLYELDRATGQRTRVIELPASYGIANQSPVGDAEIAGNTSGRVSNKGMEGLAITPDGATLIGAMQSALLQDGGTVTGRFTRLITIDLAGGATHQYAYELNNIGTVAKPKYPTVSEIVAINDHELLVDERDGKGFGDGSVAVYKRIYRVDLTGAQDVSNVTGVANLAGKAVAKTLFLDLVVALNANGIASTEIPAKIEGLAFGPDLVAGGVSRHTLFVATDNDFTGTVVDSLHPAGKDNPSRFYVFAVDPSVLPGFEPQEVCSLPDADADGIGDSCDPDDDNDGVGDDADECPTTPPATPSDPEGCSIGQRCPCAGPAGGGTWSNHGAYVNCVNDAEGFSKPIMKEAKKLKCGK